VCPQKRRAASERSAFCKLAVAKQPTYFKDRHEQSGKETAMLANSNATANLAVRDLERAKAFYGGTLGLEQVDDLFGELIVYKSGDTTINVYRSQFAGTNKATAVTWTVGDQIETVVKSLKSKGVAFEHYEMPGLTIEGDVHVGQGMTVAWFKDPDGNILNLVNR
jgi:catechol 2,3-dioxygenase-like lactoylglutathione lyase family enzyme